ncbi:MAG: hypothetical protein WBA31_04925, partial [Candidatus Dormiibacterota bacterium]
RVDRVAQEVLAGSLAAGWATADPALQVRVPPAPLEDYQLVEVLVGEGSTGRDGRIDGVVWPPDWIPVAISADHAMTAIRGDIVIRAGDRLLLLVPSTKAVASSHSSDEASLR